MQLDGAIQGGPSTSRPRRRPLSVLVAILVISAMVALLVWAGAFARSGVGTADAGAGSSAIIHDDPWNVPHKADACCSAPIHDDPWKVHSD